MVSGSHLVGSQVGQYEVKQVIGQGGMGTVYEGLHPLIHKRVAIKVLHPHFSQDPGMVGRFLAEAKAVNAIGHRGIIDIFGFGQLPEGHHYFVMELLEGRSLSQVLKAEGRLPVDKVLQWADEILDALSAAHEAGVVHRDLKPSNLFLVEPAHGKRYVKVLDFGIAKLLTHGPAAPAHTRTGLVGTPSHISPEQVTGEEITPAADLYSLGCVLFELLTGAPPFIADSALGVMTKHLEEPAPLVSSRALGIPPELDRAVAELLRKAPEQRPASAEAVRVTLAAVAQPPGTGSSAALTRIAAVLPDAVRITRTDAEASDAALAPLELTPPPPRTVGETRVAELTAQARAAAEPTDPVAAPLASETLAPPPTPKRRPPFAALAVVAGIGVVALALLLWPRQAPSKVEEIPLPPVLVAKTPEAAATPTGSDDAPDDPAGTVPTDSTPVPAHTDTVPAEPSRPHPKSGRSGPTRSQLDARLAALEKRLAAHERELGDKDALLRGQLLRARTEARGARTAQDLAGAERLVASLEQLLR